jgi:methanogenic corrinoid protein MtbC1
MPGLQPISISNALDVYEKSSTQVRTLKSKLPESDVSGIVREVLSIVRKQALRNDDSVSMPSREKVERLCYALISDDAQEGHRFIERVYNAGASLVVIYLNYLAEAAVVFGEWWENDTASFYEVTIGTSRIYAIMRALGCLFVPESVGGNKSAVFASIPGETHTLGVRMAADLFGKEGWDIELIVGKDHHDLVAEITQSRCRIIGLSAGGAHSISALARLVVALRLSNPKAAIFLSGQIANDIEEVVSHMEFDGIMSDMPTALAMLNDHWESLTAT